MNAREFQQAVAEGAEITNEMLFYLVGLTRSDTQTVLNAIKKIGDRMTQLDDDIAALQTAVNANSDAAAAVAAEVQSLIESSDSPEDLENLEALTAKLTATTSSLQSAVPAAPVTADSTIPVSQHDGGALPGDPLTGAAADAAAAAAGATQTPDSGEAAAPVADSGDVVNTTPGAPPVDAGTSVGTADAPDAGTPSV